MAEYTDEELGAKVFNEIAQATGADSDDLQSHRQNALKYYYNKARGDEKAGESTVQSSDLADMTNAVLAQLTPMVSSDALVVFEAQGEQDEDQARGETHAINEFVMDKNRGYVSLQECLKNAALCRTAFAKVWSEDTEDVEVRNFSDLSRREINRIVKLLNEPEGQEAEEQQTRDGETTIKVKTERRTFRWRAVDPINVLYESGHDGMDLQGLRFFAEYDYPTRSDLISEGVPESVVEQIPSVSARVRHEELARDRKTETRNFTPQTPDQERVERHDCYLRIDMDGDGISELWRIIVANKKLVLHKEMVQWIPYAAGSLFLAPHRIEGEDLYDRLKQTQDTKTAALRRWVDGLYNGVWPRMGAQENVVDPAIDDARSGATIWTKGPPAQSLMQVPVLDIGPSCLSLLQYEDQRRTERGGAALDMQAADAQLVGETYGGIQKQYSVKETLTQMMAKNIAETLIRDVYLLMHRTLRTFSTEPVQVKLRGMWSRMDARQWPARSSVNVLPGLTPSARAAMKASMQSLLQLQIMALQQGKEGQIATLDGIYRAAIDMARADGVDNPGQYLVDPSSQEAQQAAQRAAQQQQAMAQQQQQMLAMQMQLAQAQLEVEREKTRSKQYVDIYKTDVDAELKEAELVMEGRQNAVDAQQRARESAAKTAATATSQGGGANGGSAG